MMRGKIKTDYLPEWKLKVYCLPPPQREYRFHPVRRFRFDYVWPEKLIAVEINGGVWGYGRHNRASGYIADMEKLNLAAELGWRVLQYTPQNIDWEQIRRIINK